MADYVAIVEALATRYRANSYPGDSDAETADALDALLRDIRAQAERIAELANERDRISNLHADACHKWTAAERERDKLRALLQLIRDYGGPARDYRARIDAALAPEQATRCPHPGCDEPYKAPQRRN